MGLQKFLAASKRTGIIITSNKHFKIFVLQCVKGGIKDVLQKNWPLHLVRTGSTPPCLCGHTLIFKKFVFFCTKKCDHIRITRPPPWLQVWTAPNHNPNHHFVCLKGELGELQIYFRKIPLHQRKFLVVSVLSNSPWLPRNLKNVQN